MRKYELSISADYVPEWGVVEAVREFFQNAIDEEMRDQSNSMIFSYDSENERLIVGNKHSELDIKSLLLGNTSKNDNPDTIGKHGEGYKIATTVLLRCGKQIVFNNYCRREVWRPRLVKSRKYDGMLVPTFFVETAAVWEKIPEHSLLIEISGVTAEEYERIKESNLHLQNYKKLETVYGEILSDERFTGKVYVGGLYICDEGKLDIGVNFKTNFVRLERDRSMVSSFDIQWYASRMIESCGNKEQIKKSMDQYSGRYIYCECVPDSLKNEIAEDFINENGAKAVPVANQKDLELMKKRGWKPVITSEIKRDVILSSEYFKDVEEENRKIRESEKPLYDRFCAFAEKIESKLNEDEVVELYGFLDELTEEEKDAADLLSDR